MVGLLAAVLDARTTGVGRDVDTDLYDVALSMLTHHATWHLSAGIETVRQPMSGHASVVPFQIFATSDGHIAIAAAKERFFRDLVKSIGLPELADDERFVDMRARSTHRAELLPLSRPGSRADDGGMDGTARRRRAHLAGSVDGGGARGRRAAAALHAGGVRASAPRHGPIRGYSRLHVRPHTWAPSWTGARGDGPAILAELAYEPEEVEHLRAEGAFGGDGAMSGRPAGDGA
jgi:hypothetical protein